MQSIVLRLLQGNHVASLVSEMSNISRSVILLHRFVIVLVRIYWHYCMHFAVIAANAIFTAVNVCLVRHSDLCCLTCHRHVYCHNAAITSADTKYTSPRASYDAAARSSRGQLRVPLLQINGPITSSSEYKWIRMKDSPPGPLRAGVLRRQGRRGQRFSGLQRMPATLCWSPQSGLGYHLCHLSTVGLAPSLGGFWSPWFLILIGGICRNWGWPALEAWELSLDGMRLLVQWYRQECRSLYSLQEQQIGLNPQTNLTMTLVILISL